MLIDAILLPSSSAVVTALVHVLLCLWAIIRAPWVALWRVPGRWHLLFGAIVVLSLLWQLEGRIGPGLQLHPLGMTTVTLTLGPALAIIAGTLACGVLLFQGHFPPALFGAHALLNVTVPVLVTASVLRLALRHAPPNLFVYLLGVGFVGGGLGMLMVLLCVLALAATAGQMQIVDIWLSPILLLAMFPEGFLNGALVSALAVYRPEWLKTFDDRRFLDGRRDG